MGFSAVKTAESGSEAWDKIKELAGDAGKMASDAGGAIAGAATDLGLAVPMGRRPAEIYQLGAVTHPGKPFSAA